MEKPISTAELLEEIAALKVENAELKRELQWIKNQLILNKRKLFCASSEKSVYDLIQLSLFKEEENFTILSTEEPKLSVVKEHSRKTRLITDKLPPELPVETIEYELPQEDQICPECSGHLHRIGKETVREELKLVPAKAILKKHIRHTYGCRRCEREAEKATIIKAHVPTPVIKSSFASPESVAHIMVQKYAMGLPLYRQAQELQRNGILLSRQTMSNWLIKCSEDWLEPIYELLHRRFIKREVLSADETELQVLREPGKTAQSKSYLWVYRTGGDAEYPIVLSEYQPSRHGIHAAEFLKGFTGFCHVDGYAGYNKFPDSIITVGCWSHARRLYDKALKILPVKDRGETNALLGKRYCDKLFDIERRLSELSPNERYLSRLKIAKPVLDEYYRWLLSFHDLGKTPFGKAVRYSIEQWEKLTNYLLDGRLELSNNRTERTLKPFVISRKNFLFCNTPRGAKASAVIFSIVQTAIENGLNPYEYLVHVFENAPNMSFSENSDALERLLPQAAPDHVKVNRHKKCG